MKRYEIQYPASAYTFPSEALIHDVRFDDDYIHIARSRTMIIWDPEKCSINDELRLADYLGPRPRTHP